MFRIRKPDDLGYSLSATDWLPPYEPLLGVVLLLYRPIHVDTLLKGYSNMYVFSGNKINRWSQIDPKSPAIPEEQNAG
jgi:hypothetical protein